MVGAFAWWRENTPLLVGALVILSIAEIAFFNWMQRRHGAMPIPGRGRPPAEIGALWRRYYLTLPAIALVIAAAWWLGGIGVAASITFVLVTGGLVFFEKRYERAVGAVRARLA